jgi:hypothetical protein
MHLTVTVGHQVPSVINGRRRARWKTKHFELVKPEKAINLPLIASNNPTMASDFMVSAPKIL